MAMFKANRGQKNVQLFVFGNTPLEDSEVFDNGQIFTAGQKLSQNHTMRIFVQPPRSGGQFFFKPAFS
jgi:hypothetical protein